MLGSPHRNRAGRSRHLQRRSVLRRRRAFGLSSRASAVRTGRPRWRSSTAVSHRSARAARIRRCVWACACSSRSHSWPNCSSRSNGRIRSTAPARTTRSRSSQCASWVRLSLSDAGLRSRDAPLQAPHLWPCSLTRRCYTLADGHSHATRNTPRPSAGPALTHKSIFRVKMKARGRWRQPIPTPVLRVPGPPHKTLCTRRRAPRVPHGSTSRSRRPRAGLTFRSAAPVRLRPVLDFVVARSLALRRSGTTETGAPIDRSAFGSTLQGARRTANDMTSDYPPDEYLRALAERERRAVPHWKASILWTGVDAL